MRLATWNCCRGSYDKKSALLDAFGADISVIQECAKPKSESDSLLWFGDNPRQGLAVAARGDYRLRRVRRARSVPKYVMPVEVSGPRSFLLFAVWTKTEQEHCYVEAAVRAVYLYRKLIASQPTVFIGDTNSNSIWDAQREQDRNHTALVNRLSELGLVSAYPVLQGYKEYAGGGYRLHFEDPVGCANLSITAAVPPSSSLDRHVGAHIDAK